MSARRKKGSPGKPEPESGPGPEVLRVNAWRCRIEAVEEVDPATLSPSPANWRRHPPEQEAALAAVLGEVGWVGPILAVRDGRRIVDGHLRAEMARARGEKVKVAWLDLSPDEEALALASLDPAGLLAATEAERFLSLAERVAEDRPGMAETIGRAAAAAAACVPSEKGREYDADVGDEVEWRECPECGHRWPR